MTKECVVRLCDLHLPHCYEDGFVLQYDKRGFGTSAIVDTSFLFEKSIVHNNAFSVIMECVAISHCGGRVREVFDKIYRQEIQEIIKDISEMNAAGRIARLHNG